MKCWKMHCMVHNSRRTRIGTPEVPLLLSVTSLIDATLWRPFSPLAIQLHPGLTLFSFFFP